MSNSPLKLIYAHDTLCGWCYGFIPALRHFEKHQPDVAIEVAPGGLMTGSPAKPYSEMSSYIKGAEIRLEEVTGRKPSDAFHTMIAKDNGTVAASEVPSHAIMQMNALAPDRAAEFAHLLQEAHFGLGKDVNDPKTYDDLCAEHGFPALDTDAITKATLADPLVAKGFELCRKLGPSGYPTIFVATEDDTILGVIPSTYDPADFLDEFTQIRDAQA
jgi:putative protein-disulfide isomerase